jgi:hypothetical protein
METLLDPFELVAPLPVHLAPVPSTVPPPVAIPVPLAPAVVHAASSVEIDLAEMVEAVEVETRRPLPPSPDSSGRLRCWCSED